MTEPIHAFSIPLGPARPGLYDTQMQKRKAEVYRILQATMPSSRYLLANGVLQERTVSDGRLLWLEFDLVESPQLALPWDCRRGASSKGMASTLNGLYAELVRLKDEADSTVIRVGALKAFAARLETLSGTEFSGAIDSLSEQDWKLWRLIHARKGKPVSIEFPTVGTVGITMPLFASHIAERRQRRVRFRVEAPTRKMAEVSIVADISDQQDAHAVRLPKTVDLIRPIGQDLADRNRWFLLYVAEFRNLVVEAEVRLVLKMSDFSPSHLELVGLGNAAELQSFLTSVE